MCKYSILIFFVAFLLVETNVVQGQDDQSGFISIDCGITDGSNYTDPSTGLFYTSDAGFIDSGISESVSSIYLTDSLAEQYVTLRSFPEGTRNCYTLRPGKGQKYLIRASFMYGNYDGKNQTTAFDIFLGADYWDTVNLTDPSRVSKREIVHTPLSDYIYVCLVKTSSYTPFISALELRPLEDTMYATTDKSLQLYARANINSIFSDNIRFKDDIYDRVWPSFNPTSNTTVLSTKLTVDTSNVTFTRPPPLVMSTGREPINVNGNLSFSWNPINITTDKYYIFFHFAELQILGSKELREFNIYLNGDLWYGPFSPVYLKAKTIYKQIPDKGYQIYKITINQTASSTRPPLLNAFEIFTAIKLTTPGTEDTNVEAMLDIKSMYKLIRNWQGDPCVPQTSVWDGINCSYHGPDPATIISLNLSSYGLNHLNGTIAPSIINLSELVLLDLSNNNLTGEVPDFLAELDSLTVLNLKGNSFTGPIPKKLLEKSNDGTLLLSIDDLGKFSNVIGGTEKNEGVLTFIASVSAVLFIVLVAGL